MSANPKPDKPVTLIKNAATAPVIFAEQAPAYGHFNGVIEVTLAARLLAPRSDDSVAIELAAQAHLRTSIAGAKELRKALDKAIEMAEAPEKIKLAS